MKKDIENKNKLKLKTKSKSKILVLGFIFIILVGLLSPAIEAKAETPPLLPSKSIQNTTTAAPSVEGNMSGGQLNSDATVPTVDVPGTTTTTSSTPANTAFQDEVDRQICSFLRGNVFPGCLVQGMYYIMYVVPSLLLAVVAYFFNILISITLSSTLLKSAFISEAWRVVRDLSNIFFILILLYISIKIILDLGGHEAKKMIAKVIIIALLINFSMFFTQVVIDSSNILASIFYNKLKTEDKDSTGKIVNNYQSVNGERDISGGLVSAFDPTSALGKPFFDSARTPVQLPGQTPGLKSPDVPVPAGMMVGIIITTGAIFLFAAYALFISGLSFLGRLIELFVLIIFSPFAFMSSTIPLLGHVEYIGWDAWFKRLLKTAFMAPIFMFFLYFIFMLVRAKMYNDILKPGDGIIIALLRMIIPALFILILLLKATEFAKKGSGKFGEVLMTGAKMVGGLALGAATGGAAVLGRATLGRAGAAMANSEWAKQREREGKFGSRAFTKVAGGIGSGNFDVRGVKIGGKTLASATGMNVGEAKKGGFTERKREAIENRAKRAKELQVGENDPLKQALNKTEMDLQGLLGAQTQEIETIDKLIEKKRQEASDAERKLKAARPGAETTAAKAALKNANTDLDNAKERKTALREGRATSYAAVGGVMPINDNYTGVNVGGASIDTLEKQQKTQAQKIKTKNVLSNQQYAVASQKGGVRALNFVLTGGAYTKAAAEEAAHKIVMETKLDSGTHT